MKVPNGPSKTQIKLWFISGSTFYTAGSPMLIIPLLKSL